MRARLGTTISFSDPSLAELIATTFEFVWIDLEHGSLSIRDVQTLAIAAQSADAAALVRIPSPQFDRVGAVLDSGVDGVVIPMVESRAHIMPLIDRLHYPPHGARGLAPRRAARYGRSDPTAYARPEVVVQIETPAGVANAEEIAALESVDVVFVGTSDLALTIGNPDELESQIAKVRAAARATGKRWGVSVGLSTDPNVARDADTVLLGSDVSLVAHGVDGAAAALRRWSEARCATT
jgi:4-hydroxy-2-oxoheptanedioate aldolase